MDYLGGLSAFQGPKRRILPSFVFVLSSCNIVMACVSGLFYCYQAFQELNGLPAVRLTGFIELQSVLNSLVPLFIVAGCG